jgi:hypothetical protein
MGGGVVRLARAGEHVAVDAVRQGRLDGIEGALDADLEHGVRPLVEEPRAVYVRQVPHRRHTARRPGDDVGITHVPCHQLHVEPVETPRSTPRVVVENAHRAPVGDEVPDEGGSEKAATARHEVHQVAASSREPAL